MHNFDSLNHLQRPKLPSHLPTHNTEIGRQTSGPVFHNKPSWRWGLAFIILAAIFIIIATTTAQPTTTPVPHNPYPMYRYWERD